MADSKDEDKKEKIPYEPPRLFDLGGGVAYAADPQCTPGGSAAAKCQSGNMATASGCKIGNIATKCGAGGVQ